MNYTVNTTPDIPMSTSETIRERIMAMPEDEEFIITIPIGGDPNANE